MDFLSRGDDARVRFEGLFVIVITSYGPKQVARLCGKMKTTADDTDDADRQKLWRCSFERRSDLISAVIDRRYSNRLLQRDRLGCGGDDLGKTRIAAQWVPPRIEPQLACARGIRQFYDRH